MNLDFNPKPGERVGGLLECHRVKIFADGSLGGRTAALSKPYLAGADKSHDSGGSSAEKSDSKKSTASSSSKDNGKQQQHAHAHESSGSKKRKANSLARSSSTETLAASSCSDELVGLLSTALRFDNCLANSMLKFSCCFAPAVFLVCRQDSFQHSCVRDA